MTAGRQPREGAAGRVGPAAAAAAAAVSAASDAAPAEEAKGAACAATPSKPPPAAAKRAKPEDATVPLKKPRGEEHPTEATAGPLPPPAIPEEDEKPAADVMRQLVPWTAEALRAFLEKRPQEFDQLPPEGIYGQAPLDIKERSLDGLKSFKPPWTAAQCVQSMDSTGMFEAAGNITWVKPIPETEEDNILSGDPPSWGQVKELAEAHLSRAATLGRMAWKGQEINRIIFPTMLYVYLRNDSTKLNALVFRQSLRLLTGHAYVYAWWWAVYQAVRDEDVAMVASLWQAGLTVTIHLRGALDNAALAALSCAQSERHKTAERMVSDSFPAFAMKALMCLSGGGPETAKVKQLNDLNIRWKGSVVSRPMLSAILLFDGKVNAEGRALLRQIELVAGREVLNAGYTKVHRLVAAAKVEADQLGEPVESVVVVCLQSLLFALRYEQLEGKQVTLESLDRGKDGAGYPQIWVGRHVISNLLASLLEDLAATGASPALLKELQGAMRCFRSVPAFEEAFQTGACAATPGDATPGACAATPGDATPGAATQGNAEDEETDELERRKNQCKYKVTGQLYDFGYDLLSGAFDDEIAKAMKEKSAAAGAVSWLEADGFDLLRDLVRALNLHKAVVTVGCAAPPPASSRTLKRYGSQAEDGDAEKAKADMLKERDEVWKEAANLRKKYCSIGYAKCTKKDVQAWYEKTSAYNFSGRPGDSHRLFLFSADLFREARATPWASMAQYDQAADALIQFMLQQAGPGDICLWFDGRSKAWRRELDRLTEDARNLSELFIIFQPSPRLGRKVSFASESREVAWLSHCLPRTRVRCKDRKEYCKAGETSTHDTTYTGVEPMPWQAMPPISLADKETILGFDAATPRSQLYDSAAGVPLFGQERKPPSFWRALLLHLDVKCVVDLAPGSGACARAALDAGIPYTGLALNAEHNSWLQNVLNRTAMRTIVTEKSDLYDDDFAKSIKAHFQDVLDQLHQQDACQDEPPEDDGE